MKQWNCEHCHGPIGPVPNLAGQTVACPYCLAPIMVPSNNTETKRRRSRWRWMLAMVTVLAVAASIGLIVNPYPLPNELYGYALPDFLLTHHDRTSEIAAVDDWSAVAELEKTLHGPVTDQQTTGSTFEKDAIQPLSPEVVEEVVQNAVREVVQTAVHESVHESVHEAVQIAVQTSVQTAVHDAVQDSVQAVMRESVKETDFVPPRNNKALAPPARQLPEQLYGGNQHQQGPSSNDGRPIEPAPQQPGLGINWDRLIHAIQSYFDVEFYEENGSAGDREEITAQIAGAELTLSGSSSELKSIRVAGGFRDDNMGILLLTIIGQVMPSWHIEDAADWFRNAVESCNAETLVSTVRDNVELTMTDAGDGNFWVFFQADRE